MSLKSSEIPDTSDLVYYGKISVGNDLFDLGLINGTPTTLSPDAVKAYFSSKGLGNVNEEEMTLQTTLQKTPDLLSPRLVENTAPRGHSREATQLSTSIKCVDQDGNELEYNFDTSYLLLALSAGHKKPLIIPRKDTWGTGESFDSRYLAIYNDKGDKDFILLPNSEMASEPEALENAYRLLGADVVKSIFNGIMTNDLHGTEKGKYFLAVLLNAVHVRPEKFENFKARFRSIGIETDRLTGEFDERVDNAQEAVSDRLMHIAEKFELDASRKDHMLSAVNRELAADIRDLEPAVLFEIIDNLAAFPQPE